MTLSDLSLNDILATHGLTTRPATCEFNMYAKEIIRSGVVLFVGDSVEVWAWLRAKGFIK